MIVSNRNKWRVTCLEWLLELVIGARRNLIILQIFLPMEVDLFRLNLAVLHIHLQNKDDKWTAHGMPQELNQPCSHKVQLE